MIVADLKHVYGKFEVGCQRLPRRNTVLAELVIFARLLRPGRVDPGKRAAACLFSEAAAFQQSHTRARPRQVIGDRSANDTTANDRHMLFLTRGLWRTRGQG